LASSQVSRMRTKSRRSSVERVSGVFMRRTWGMTSSNKEEAGPYNNSRNALYLTDWNHTILRILDEHNTDHGLVEAGAGTWIQPVMRFLTREARVRPIRFWGALSAIRPHAIFPGCWSYKLLIIFFLGLFEFIPFMWTSQWRWTCLCLIGGDPPLPRGLYPLYSRTFSWRHFSQSFDYHCQKAPRGILWRLVADYAPASRLARVAGRSP